VQPEWLLGAASCDVSRLRSRPRRLESKAQSRPCQGQRLFRL